MNDTKTIAVSISHNDLKFFKDNGINRSEFMRQAKSAYEQGKFKYDKSKQR